MTIGERIYTLRKQKGMTQEGLAEKLGVSRQALARWEVDETLPDTANLLKLCDYFSISADWLLRGEETVGSAIPAGTRLHERALRLLDRRGHTGAYILGMRCLLGALVCLLIGWAYLSVLLGLAPFSAWLKIPPALLLPGAAVIAALVCIVRAIFWFVLGRRIKKLR